MGIETQRRLELFTPLGEDKLLIHQLHGTEQLSTCFEYVLSLYSEDHDIDPDKLLGQHVSIRVQCGGQPERYIDGIACEFGHTGFSGRYASYHLVLRPWLWLLSTRTDCRLFQKLTSVEILREVVDGWQDAGFEIDLRVQDAPEERELCIQYSESDLNFVTRLLEDDGLYFFFEHERDKHKLVIADHKGAHKPAPSFEKLGMRRWESERTDAASILNWRATATVKPGGVALRDYDFEKPRADIDVEVKKPKTSHARDKVAEIYEYPGHYREVDSGKKRLDIRLEEQQATFATIEATTDASGISAGTLFTLEAHKRSAENQEYLVTAAMFQVDSGAFESGESPALEFLVKLRCVPTRQRFRPARKTPWPVIPGAQTATVVGHKEGEITTDEYGRVKVHFAWNRARRADKAADPPDKHCSCWVRVAQAWTGSGWGALFIPRVGQEVVVDFLDGNPDRPLITGCVYNNRNKPPYELPAKASQSGWKTRSLNEGGADEYNELRFDDDKDHEQIVIQAQRDMKTTVKNNDSLRVGGTRKVTVDKGDHLVDVNKGLMTIHVHQDTYTLQAKNVYEVASEKLSMNIASTSVEVTMTADAIKLCIMNSSIELTAQGIEIKANGNSITLGPTGVDIKGMPQIKLNS